jgi:cephalosporin hydroxylase
MLTIDEARGEVTVFGPDGRRAVHPMDTAEAFEVLSAAWLRSGRDVKYAYGFTWMGRPVIRMPEDMIRIQELIWRVRPDVIVETGIAHGGSLVFYASLFAAMGHGRVIGVEPDIEPHNRVALAAHPLAARISLIEGSTAAGDTLAAVRSMIKPDERVLVVLERVTATPMSPRNWKHMHRSWRAAATSSAARTFRTTCRVRGGVP